MYYGQIQSLITYGLSIWGTLVRAPTINRLQKIQNQCLSCIEPRMKPKECALKHRIMTVKNLIRLEQTKLGYKVCKGMLPIKLQKCLITDSKNKSLLKSHAYFTRHKGIPNVPKMHTSLYHNSFMHTCIKEYSAVAGIIDTNVALKSFINKCREYYLKN